MRLGLIADVHANLPALEAALAFLSQAGVERVVCAGDLVGYGPDPNQVVERIMTEAIACVAGNHDLMATDRQAPRCSSLGLASLRWTKRVLGAESRSFLEGLPTSLVINGVAAAHGSWHDPDEYVTTVEQADRDLAAVTAAHPQVRLLVLGHTHQPWRHAGRTAWLLNPGSVGQSRQPERRPHVRLATVDTATGMAAGHVLPYDADRCRSALRAAGLPAWSLHFHPGPVHTTIRRVRGKVANRGHRV